MFCSNCGFYTEDNIKFCPGCGKRIEQMEADRTDGVQNQDDPSFADRDTEYIKPSIISIDSAGDTEAKSQSNRSAFSKNLRMKLILGAAATILAAVVLLLTVFLKEEEQPVFYEFSDQAIQIYNTEDGTLILDREGDVQHLEGQYYTNYCMDRSAAVLVNQYSGNLEYYINEKDNYKFQPGIYEFALSVDGNTLVYALDTPNGDNHIYLYDTVNKEETILVESSGKRYTAFSISPDGGTVAYATIETGSADFYEMKIESYLIKDRGEPISLGNNQIILAVSNHAENVYYCLYEDKTIHGLYVNRKGEVIDLGGEFGAGYIALNRDYTEMLYTDSRRTYCFSDQGEIREVTGAKFTGVLQPAPATNIMQSMIQICNFDSFENKLISCDDNMVRLITDKDTAKLICQQDYDTKLMLAQDGKSLLYSYKGTLKREKLTGNGLELYASDMKDYRATDDLSQIYYLKEDKLYYLSGKEKPVFLEEEVRGIYRGTDRKSFFYLKGKDYDRGSLYGFRVGKEPELLLDNIYIGNISDEDGLFLRKELVGETEYFYNEEGTELKLVWKE